ncbi:MAG: xanthine dehydrogenase family protein molybdopterin-binding subunit [Rubrivivax sp.]|nr:xanthine dehydrogenase family protein molybdopterin-binding subunit [Rubrivivax sp.]
MSAIAQRFGSGQSVRRIEDPALVAGKGQFTDDVTLPNQTWMSVQRSPYPHARIVAIDTSAARALPGVVAVYTGDDLVKAGVKPLSSQPVFPGPGGAKAPQTPRHALAVGEARFVGEAVVAVIATSPDAARAGRDAVIVDYEELPNVTHLDDATAAGAPKVWADAADNYAAQMRHGNAEACAAAFAKAAHVVTLDLVNQRLAPTSLEPRSVLGSYENGRVTLRLSSQMPGGVRDTLCNEAFGWPTDKLRVLVGDVGGGFGMKTGAYPEDILVAHGAHTLQRPVKWISERSEEFLASSHGRDIRSHVEMALDADGRVLGLRTQTLANVGAYATTTGVIIQLLIGPWVTTSIYDIQTIDLTLSAVLTNTTPLGAYRGAGRPEAIFIIERLMDTAARQIGMDPAELRRRNMIRPEQMPYTNPMGQVYDSGKFESVQTQALALADWAGFDARAAASRQAGKLRGRGLASFLEWTGGNVFEERVTVNVSGDGFIEVFSATQAMGQGIATSYAQLVVDVFGVPIEKVRIVQGDTDRGVGFGSAGSRSIFVGGSAIQVASQRTVEKAQGLAAEALETSPRDIEYREGVFRVAGTDRQIGLFELAAKQAEHQVFVDSTSAVQAPSWPNACHICEVEIDPDTGVVQVASYASVNDVGRAINPTIVIGQLDGGAVQGLGQALCEQVVYERESGQLQTGTLMDYALPRVDLIQRFNTQLDQSTPCLTNPLGVKGVGELGTIGATPAVVNAVVDALQRAGAGARADQLQMPLTSERVWSALHGRTA